MIKSKWKKHKKKIIVISSIIVGVVFLVEFAIHPIIAAIFIGPVEHTGTELYTSEAYLQYKNAETFQEELNKLDFIEDCTIEHFYHSDSWPLDTLIYGRVADTFCLDLQAGANYDQIKQETLAASLETTELNDWDVGLIGNRLRTRNLSIYSNSFLVAFDDETETVRCILIADVSGKSKITNLVTIMIHYSGIDWH